MAGQTGTVFVVGRDVQAVLVGPGNVGRFDLTNLTSFDVKPQYKVATCEPLNSPPAERALPSGHRITFNIDRRDGTNDRLFLAIETGWWARGSADGGTGSNGMLTVFINEVNGGQTREQYSGISVRMSNKGDVRQDSPLKQTIEVFASRRVQ